MENSSSVTGAPSEIMPLISPRHSSLLNSLPSTLCRLWQYEQTSSNSSLLFLSFSDGLSAARAGAAKKAAIAICAISLANLRSLTPETARAGVAARKRSEHATLISRELAIALGRSFGPRPGYGSVVRADVLQLSI